MCVESHMLNTVRTDKQQDISVQVTQKLVIRLKRKSRFVGKYVNDAPGRSEKTRTRLQHRNKYSKVRGMFVCVWGGGDIVELQEGDNRGEAGVCSNQEFRWGLWASRRDWKRLIWLGSDGWG